MVAGEIVPTNVTHVHFEYPCNFRPPGLEIDEIVVVILFLGDLFWIEAVIYRTNFRVACEFVWTLN